MEGDLKIILDMAKDVRNGRLYTKVAMKWMMEGRLDRLEDLMTSQLALSFTDMRQDGNKVVDSMENIGT